MRIKLIVCVIIYKVLILKRFTPEDNTYLCEQLLTLLYVDTINTYTARFVYQGMCFGDCKCDDDIIIVI